MFLVYLILWQPFTQAKAWSLLGGAQNFQNEFWTCEDEPDVSETFRLWMEQKWKTSVNIKNVELTGKLRGKVRNHW